MFSILEYPSRYIYIYNILYIYILYITYMYNPKYPHHYIISLHINPYWVGPGARRLLHRSSTSSPIGTLRRRPPVRAPDTPGLRRPETRNRILPLLPQRRPPPLQPPGPLHIRQVSSRHSSARAPAGPESPSRRQLQAPRGPARARIPQTGLRISRPGARVRRPASRRGVRV
jgi:hypothetical protein